MPQQDDFGKINVVSSVKKIKKMSQRKTILQGRLDFGNAASYGKVKKLFDTRLDAYYKGEFGLKDPEYFNDETFIFSIPRLVFQWNDKTWKTTVEGLEYLASYAISGQIEVYQSENGVIHRKNIISPDNEKLAVSEYKRGEACIRAKNPNWGEALTALNEAIHTYDAHVEALEYRGKVLMHMCQWEEAKADLNRAIAIYPGAYKAHYWRAMVYYHLQETERSLLDFETSVKNSLALQQTHWLARLGKSRCLIDLGAFEDAIKELKLFVGKNFSAEMPLNPYKREAYHNMGVCWMELELYDYAIDAFDEALKIKDGDHLVSEASCLYHRGIAKKRAGNTGFNADLEKAQKMGYAGKVQV